jgi:peptidyl-prolyl cis-trans isomerase SurA
MKNKLILVCLFIAYSVSSGAQTLFSVGNEQVTKAEFLNAFQKNNSEKPTEQSIREYLDLYSRYRLKVKAAYELGLDTTAAQKSEVEDFRNQIIETYMNDQSTLNRLIREAYDRSLKDVRVSHIYVPIDPQHPADTAKAWKMVSNAYNELKRGTDFRNVAAIYSADTSVRTNKGDIGYITSFTLPYDVESIIYNLPAGGFSKPWKGGAGYHIFRKTDERPAAGTVKIAQILLTFPPDADKAQLESVKKTADSISAALKNGASFNQLAIRYNTDKLTLTSTGVMPEFGVGKFSPDFESAVFALSTPGEISKPITTTHGYHVVKLIERKSIKPDTLEGELLSVWKSKVENDERIEIAKREAARKILAATGLKRAAINQKNLFIYSDSVFHEKKLPSLAGIKNETPLFIFPEAKITVGDWVSYLVNVRHMPSLSAGKTIPQLLEQYKEQVALEYYRDHLEKYNKDFARQVQEFREGNMLFEIMQRNVWDKASADSIGLQNFYRAHAEKYVWEPSADVVFFTAGDLTAAEDLRKRIAVNPSAWRNVISSLDGTVQADSGRYELTQLPAADADNYKAGFLSTPVKKQDEDLTSFLYIVRVYAGKAQRSFDDARGFVLNDYQQQLEENWIQELRKKYPVKVNENVLKTLWQ